MGQRVVAGPAGGDLAKPNSHGACDTRNPHEHHRHYGHPVRTGRGFNWQNPRWVMRNPLRNR